jgi:hypothetical protein
MERYFEEMKSLVASALLVLLSACGRPQDDSAIVKKYIAAGGGDPDSAQDWQIQAWFAKHQDVRKQFEQPCAPLLNNPPNANWLTSAEGKICSAQGRAKRVEYKSDGSKF